MKVNDKLSEQIDGSFLVLVRTTCKFVIQLGDVVERVNVNVVGWPLAPDITVAPCDELEETPEDLGAKI